MFVKNISGKGPLTITPEMKTLAESIAPWNSGEYRKALGILSWMKRNVKYDPLGKTDPGAYIYKPAHEVFETGLGICEDQSYLYTVLARYVGLQTQFLEVTIDRSNANCSHICPQVSIGGSLVQVDSTYGCFDAKHIETRVLSDEEVIETYYRYKHSYEPRESKNLSDIIVVDSSLKQAFQRAQELSEEPISRPETFFKQYPKPEQTPKRLKYFVLGASLAGTAHTIIHYYSQLPRNHHKFTEKSLILLMHQLLSFLN